MNCPVIGHSLLWGYIITCEVMMKCQTVIKHRTVVSRFRKQYWKQENNKRVAPFTPPAGGDFNPTLMSSRPCVGFFFSIIIISSPRTCGTVRFSERWFENRLKSECNIRSEHPLFSWAVHLPKVSWLYVTNDRAICQALKKKKYIFNSLHIVQS